MDNLTNIDIEVRSLLNARRVTEALESLRNAAIATGTRSVLDRIDSVEENYALLSRYALDGASDPRRAAMLDDIKARLYAIALEIKRQYLLPTESSLYFNIVRTLQRRAGVESLSGLMEEYRKVNSDISLARLAGDAPRDLLQNREALESNIFNHLWVTYPLGPDAAAAVTEIFHDTTLPGYFKEMIVGALFLALNTWLDETRLMLLADIYDRTDDDRAGIKALTALLLALWLHNDALFSSRIVNRLAALRETRSDFDADLRDAMMQVIRTRDTDRITRKMTDEVIPGMMKLRPDIEKNFKSGGEMRLDPEANPEWEEMLEKSGLASQLRELQEMQEEGADVMMSTFGNLKTFPFFNDIAHWFTPFHSSGTIGAGEQLASALESTPLFCDNDKYSFILSLSHIPSSQRRLMEEQIDMAATQMGMMAAGDTTTARDRRSAIARNYTRDLYRFFKLFRRKGEFRDPFREPVNPLRVPLVGNVLSEVDMLSLISEFYFKNRYWDEAAQMLEVITAKQGATIQLLQKTGYARQQLKQYPEAIAAYSRAEMLGDDSLWLVRRLGATLLSAGRYEEALEYYRRIAAEDADDLKTTLLIGNILMKLNRHDEALKYFHKVDYLTPGKADRPMIWATFMTGNYEKCAALTSRLLADDTAVSANDLLNAGHLSLVTGDYRQAAERYSQAIAANDFDFDAFMIKFAGDRAILRDKGISPDMEGIVLDHALRLSRSRGTRL